MMQKRSLKTILFSLVLIGLLTLAACGDSKEESSGNISEDVDYTITGIEPGAGVFQASEDAIEDYDLDGWEVQASSSGAMATELGEAIKDEKPIIVTGWSPHWKFSEYDLKYLEDPENTFGDEEDISTMVREGLEEDEPEAYKVLDQFSWTTDDLEAVMLDVHEGAEPEEAAANWIEENQDKVDSWTEGTSEVSDNEIELVYVNWDTEISSTNVVGHVLEELGYDVTLTAVDNAIMWEAIAKGEADGMVAAWLPGTHGELYEDHKDSLVDLGPNLEGAKIGLVVPEYMDIDSIEDLEAK